MDINKPDEYEVEEEPTSFRVTQYGTDEPEPEVHDDDGDLFGIPRIGPVLLKAHDKAVNTITLDNSGAHLLSGSDDYTCWDFGGMDAGFRPFRSLEPFEGHPLFSVSQSPNGEFYLIVSSASFPKVFTRDGINYYGTDDFASGDPYVYQVTKNKGHRAGLCDGHWHPTDKKRFHTSSMDGCVENFHSSVQCIVIKNKQGKLSGVTTSKYSASGQHIACDDETLKMWDIRAPKAPMHVVSSLHSMGDRAALIFSPDDKLAITGTVPHGKIHGNILCIDVATNEEACSIPLGEGIGCRDIIWHPKIQQLLAACTDGSIRTWYGKNSNKGVLMGLKKKIKAADAVVDEVLRVDYVPGDIKKPVRQLDKHWHDRLEAGGKSMKYAPTKGVVGHGQDGRLGDNVQAYMLKKLKVVDRINDQATDDPREALLKFAKEAEAPAYARTQPKTLFSAAPQEEDE